MNHNLPKSAPYKKFFGRRDALNLIEDRLLNRIGHIASIDGVGGIGKTALTYKFCKDFIVDSKKFDYLVWVSAKEDRFDSLEREGENIKLIENEFTNNSIEILIEETIKVVGFQDMFSGADFIEKKMFFEKEILGNERIMFVIDNLESIKNKAFFTYIDDFATYQNPNLKVLTTSRRREKELTDNAVLVTEMSQDDAIEMLKYYAKHVVEKPVKIIENNSILENARLVDRAARVPLLIEFLVGQMANGKSLGQIYTELDGFPELSSLRGEEKNRVLSDIIKFCFKNMYEELPELHQRVLMLIASWTRNKTNAEGPATIDFVVSMTGLSILQAKEIISDLIENQLIFSVGVNSYDMKENAIALCKQYYPSFSKIEEDVEVLRSRINSNGDNKEEFFEENKLKFIISRANELIDKRDLFEAEKIINNIITDSPYSEDYRLHHKLALIYKNLNQFNKAQDAFMKAINFEAADRNVWFDWIDMEGKRGRVDFAISKSRIGVKKTNDDIVLLIQWLDLLKFKRRMDDFREVVKEYLKIYSNASMEDEYTRLLQHWKGVEYNLLKDGGNHKFFVAIDRLIGATENDKEKYDLIKEANRAAQKYNFKGLNKEYIKRLKKEESRMLSRIDNNIKQLKWMHTNHKYHEAKKEAEYIIKILNFSGRNSNTEKRITVIRILMQILASEEDYLTANKIYRQNLQVVKDDHNCKNVFLKSLKILHPEYGDNLDRTKGKMKALVSNNNFTTAFNMLNEYAKIILDDELTSTLSVIGSNHKSLESDNAKGTIHRGEYDLMKNQLNSRLLSLIDSIE